MKRYIFLAFEPETGEMLGPDFWKYSHIKELWLELHEHGHLTDLVEMPKYHSDIAKLDETNH